MEFLRLSAIAALLIAGATALAAPTGKDAAPAAPAFETAMARGDVLLAAGDNGGAEAQYRIALQQAPAGEARADVLHKLGIALAHQRRFEDAEPLIAEAERIARARGGILLADVLRAKTFVLYRTGRAAEARAAFREAKRLLETTANAWETDGDGKTWIHLPSGQRFPETAGPFNRLRRTMLDDTGRNVVVHYRLGPAGQAATLVSVYLSVERGVPLDEEFNATADEILRRYPRAQPVRRGASAVSGLAGYEAVLDLPPAANGFVRRTSLHAFEAGKVMFRIRSSYPRADAETTAGRVRDLARTLLSPVTRP